MDAKTVASALGLLSIGLGVTQLIAPRALGRTIGVGEHPVAMRSMGIREVATGAAVLSEERPKTGLWARVFGDLLDLSVLATVAAAQREHRGRIAVAAGMVAAVGIADYLCAREL